jgi:glycosyltransferase involved in cell wall biosynthesis
MRLTHTIDQLGHQPSGLTSTVVPLCEALGRRGHEVEVLSIARIPPIESGWFAHHTFPASLPLRIGLSRDLERALRRTAARADVLHAHSLWRMASIYPAWVSRDTGVPFVVSAHGTLSAQAFEYAKLSKGIAWSLVQRSAVATATCLHATSPDEAEDYRRVGLTQPIALIPLGVNAPPRNLQIRRHPRRLLYLGRLHPIKGLEQLLRQWSKLEEEFQDWELRIVGSGDHAYADHLKTLALQLQLKRVTFAGPRYNEDKWKEFLEATLYTLPSQSENFGMTIAEALAAGTPVVVSSATPWSTVEEIGCGWHAPLPALGEILRSAMQEPMERLAERGAAGQAWMAREFSWEKAAESMEAVYNWAAGRAQRPPCVHD